MAESDRPNDPSAIPSLEQMQHWTRIIGQAQQMMLEQAMTAIGQSGDGEDGKPAAALPYDPEALAAVQGEFATDAMDLWRRFLASGGGAMAQPETGPAAGKDRRFADPRWQELPLFDLIRQSYLLIASALLKLPGTTRLDKRQQDQLRFATQGLIDAASPTNFPLTNPAVLDRIIETKGESLIRGLQNMLKDLEKGQLTQADPQAFQVGRDIASTPGEVIHETRLYQLIHYKPTTPDVLKTPLVIFPAWINRFYILDLAPEKSFVRWALDQGISVFMVSWKSADSSMADIVMDDYVLAQVDAIDTVRGLLDVPSVHTIGYCVAGTTLAATLALLAARTQADKVASATFFVAQVDFEKAGDLSLFVSDDALKLIETLSAPGYLDGRYMAATFNMLRGRDLIWSYVENNYLKGQDYLPFDLLFWNGDTTNVPVTWHLNYLADLYRDNKLVVPGAMTIDGTPLDLSTVKTPAYVQAAREDHIAPPESVWRITEHFAGPLRFVLAASGHIAGVVNPPATGRYGYWINDEAAETLDQFIAGAAEHKGSWWPDWLGWIEALGPERVKASKARIPGKGRLKPIEPAPGRYVTAR